ncbi:MAG: conjugal transfer protein TraF [Helicobacter trogontum]|uniref:conjugal transfer protein TraF n=1 Tax=Helicobacter trogontum TaxID=50960 RepID=UPI00242E96B6|nr:conjugal transfer protein TraF [Helicobacter trogontum]MCI5787719.1 conjugal transfer protein TraF [Helicobacter trogontum]
MQYLRDRQKSHAFILQKHVNQIAKSKNYKRFALHGLLLSGMLSLVEAMEFGTMGNVSASMGGAGVALKSPFALYYNPALIASDSKMRIGYSVGVGLSQSNLDKLTNLNFVKMVESLTSLGSQMGGGSKIATRTTRSVAPTMGVNAKDASNLTGALTKALEQSGASGNTLEELWKSYEQSHQGSADHSQLVGNLKDAVNNSSMTQEQKDMFDDFANSVDWSNFDVSNGKIVSMTIKSGSNGALDATMKDLDTLFEVLRNNNMNVISQSGIVFQLSNETIQEKFGSLAVGLFNTTQAGVSLVGDKSRMRLIFGDTAAYYELIVKQDGYTLKEASKEDYEKFSILPSIEQGNAHKIVSSAFNLLEIPVGYAYRFNFNNSELSIGITGKLMLGASLYHEQFLGSNLQFNTKFASNIHYNTTFGIDIGSYYGYDLSDTGQLGVGLVIKNINTPTFRFDGAPTISIKPQYRAGIAYNGKRFSLAFDADVLPNKVLTYSQYGLYSQMIGGGFKLDYKFIDVRGGVAYDLRRDTGAILTAGVNILGFIDIAAEVGTKWVDYFGITAPKYANVRIGGSFSW